MKTWETYKEEWETLANENPDKLIVLKEIYVIMHFLEDIGASEPWKEEDQQKIITTLEGMTEAERNEFTQYFQKVKDIIGRD